MNYELAKQLKVAGFPQNDGIAMVKDGVTFDIGKNDILTDEMCFIPTLEELIEACGGNSKALIQQNNQTKWEYATDGIGATGNTPTEAVARLWLALNKKLK